LERSGYTKKTKRVSLTPFCLNLPHSILVFSGGCELCKKTVNTVEVGKCKDCELEVINVNQESNKERVKKFAITSVPSIVIDEKIKVVGVPSFPWFCGDEFYSMLEKKYPLLLKMYDS
jgi:glutaredoxin